MNRISLGTDAPAASLRVVISSCHDPFVNLALEQTLYEELRQQEVTLFLWRNSASVVIGRHQNPWLECDLDAMARAGVALVRRASGGGAVYHDLGNGNFSFLAAAEHYDQELQFSIVIAALRELGVYAERSGRNDILVDGRKVSGNAFRYRKDRSYHHGTLLINADLERLTAFLNPVADVVVESKGIASVRSKVINLSDLQPAMSWPSFSRSLITAAERAYGLRASRGHVDGGTASGDGRLAAAVSELKSWQWRYGRTPDFRRQHVVGSGSGALSLLLRVRRGCISAVEVRRPPPDSKFSEWQVGVPERLRLEGVLRTALTGSRYRPADIRRSADVAALAGDAAGICTALARQLWATESAPPGQEDRT